MMEPELAEEDTMHIRHDIPLGESQMGTHIESMMDMWLTLGLAIKVEQSDALTLSTVTAVENPYPLEVLEVDGIVLQGASRQQKHDILDQEWEELLEMVEHPSVGQHKDEAQTDVDTVSRAAMFLMCSTLQEYIDGACSISCPLWPIIERGDSFYRQLSLANRAEQWESIMGWQQHSKHVPYAVVATSDSSSRMDWREIMSWYPLDVMVFFGGSTAEQGSMDICNIPN